MEPVIVTGEEAIMMWGNNQISSYGLKFQDFSMSWSDGKVVCALIHSLFKNEFKWNELTFTNPVEDVRYCMKFMDKAGIIRYLEAEDFFIKRPDPKSITLFASELMRYSQGNYEGYSEEKFLKAKAEREEQERKEEEEKEKRKQDAIDALPKCTLCGTPITQSALEFIGKPYHDTCIKCTKCNKPLKFKALEVNEKPYCELCGRNAFKEQTEAGWIPPTGVKGPKPVRVGRYTNQTKVDNVNESLKSIQEEAKEQQEAEEKRREEERLKRIQQEEERERKEEERRKKTAEMLEKQKQQKEEEDRKRQERMKEAMEEARKKEEQDRKRREMEESERKKKEEEEKKLRLEQYENGKQTKEVRYIGSYPVCVICNTEIQSSAYEFCGYPYHENCLKCKGCNKPLKFKAQEVDKEAYCELCGRNAFKRLVNDGWKPENGVRGPVQVRINRWTGTPSSSNTTTSNKPVEVKKEEPKPVEIKKEEPKKEESKPIEVKKEEPKKEEPKPVEVKKEEPKQTEETTFEPKKDDRGNYICEKCHESINFSPFEFCGRVYHESCVVCNACKKPLRFKAQAVDNLPYCELCGRNVFKRKVSEGWVAPSGVRGPVSTRINRAK